MGILKACDKAGNPRVLLAEVWLDGLHEDPLPQPEWHCYCEHAGCLAAGSHCFHSLLGHQVGKNGGLCNNQNLSFVLFDMNENLTDA